MRECWLRPNRRVLVVAIVILLLVATGRLPRGWPCCGGKMPIGR